MTNKEVIEEFDRIFGSLFRTETLKEIDELNKNGGNWKPYPANEELKRFIIKVRREAVEEAFKAIDIESIEDLSIDEARKMDIPEISRMSENLYNKGYMDLKIKIEQKKKEFLENL